MRARGHSEVQHSDVSSMGPNGAEGKYILGACVHVDISCKEDYLCAHVRVLSL